MMGPAKDALQQASTAYRRAVEGHVYIRETLATFHEAVAKHLFHFGPAAKVLELGSHAGFITETLLQRWPDLDIVVAEEDENLTELARQRLSGRAVGFHTGPLDTLGGSFNLVVSVARHHHLPHGYLGAVRERLSTGAVYVLADELCPEYCPPLIRPLINQAEALYIVGGYVFTSQRDKVAFERTGAVPEYAAELERARQSALWHWYRFVADVAVERGYYDVASTELRSASDDLVTGSAAEHKFSPLIVEREFALAGFRQLSKHMVGPHDAPLRQSMFVYEYALAERGHH
jgi:hypothetical protein